MNSFLPLVDAEPIYKLATSERSFHFRFLLSIQLVRALILLLTVASNAFLVNLQNNLLWGYQEISKELSSENVRLFSKQHKGIIMIFFYQYFHMLGITLAVTLAVSLSRTANEGKFP